jgi:hypothetical protein
LPGYGCDELRDTCLPVLFDICQLGYNGYDEHYSLPSSMKVIKGGDAKMTRREYSYVESIRRP